MKKTRFVSFISIGFLIAIVGSSFKIETTGPASCNRPFYSTNVLGSKFAIVSPGTGAPDNPKGTCNGCHKSYSDNSGPGTLALDIGNGITKYEAGKTYTITVSINQVSITAFDFEITNRDQSGSKSAVGSFIITDNARTKLTNGNFGGAGVDYVEATACGIDAISKGTNQWTCEWKAPATNVGNITFYLGAIAANFNNATTSDYTYSKTLQLQPSVTGINNIAEEIEFNVYPNPCSENLSINYNLKKEADVIIKIIDLKGRHTNILFDEKENVGAHHYNFNLSNKKYSPGIYFLQVNIDNETIHHKLLLID